MMIRCALAACGLRYDSSFCPGIADSDCTISLPDDQFDPVKHCGVIVEPIDAIDAADGGIRHAQLTALSARELAAALHHSIEAGRDCFTVVSHSFELLSRDRKRINKVVRSRFEGLCKLVAFHPRMRTVVYTEQPPRVSDEGNQPEILPHYPLLTAERVVEQAVSILLYR